MLDAEVRKALGSFHLEAALTAGAGATTVVVGESGAGKTTLLRLLLGLLRPDQGRILVDQMPWLDVTGGINLPTWQRPVGYVPQDLALFPHLTELENVAFGPRASGMGRREAWMRAERLLERFQIGELAERKPAMLSGGQQQRVALARALVLEPRLLLLDEPLSSLDLQTRRVVRAELKALLRTLPCVTLYVTHTPLEALVFGDQFLVLEGGQVTQRGTRDSLLHPRTPYVAEFMGVNLLNGRSGIASADSPKTDDRFMAISPREIVLSLEPPAGSARNVFRGPITELVPEPPFGERVRVGLGTQPPLVAEVTPEAVTALGLREGLVVYASFKATAVTSYG